MPQSVTLSDGAVVKPHVNPDVVPQVNHSISSQIRAENVQNGVPQMNGWEHLVAGSCNANSNYRCISGYTPSQEPNLSRLAQQFAISDATFSLSDSPSWGGHLVVVTSNLDGFPGNVPKRVPGVHAGVGWGCDSNRDTPWAAQLGGPLQEVPSCIPDSKLQHQGSPLPNGGAFRSTPVSFEPTIMDRLHSAGLSWKLYGGTCTTETTAPDGLKTCAKENGGYSWSICPSIAQCLYTGQRNVVDPSTFFTQAAAGSLPAFSIITPGGRYLADSEHNGFSITAGDDWIGQIASALMNGPEWGSTALFVTWDDCGCFYDQAKPGVNPDGTQQGPREPMLIVSPYVKPGYTDSTPTTFNGILGYVEQTFGLAPLGINDAQAYAYGDAFNYAQKPLRPVPMVHRPVPRGDHIDWAAGREDT